MFVVKPILRIAGEGSHMKVSREQVAENRRRILAEAGRLFRARGFEAVTVSDVMTAAGLTHGGFYGYFGSKEDLIAAALEDVLATASPMPRDLDRYAEAYLSAAHREDRAGGCPVAALGAETIRHSSQARAAMTDGLRRQIDRLSEGAAGADPETRRQSAIGSWATLVGAMVLARMSDDAKLSDEVLAQARAWIGRQNGDEHNHP